MSFDSLTYLAFLPTVYAVYLLLDRRWQNVWLLGASYLFYGWWDVRFLFLIVISTTVDYCCGLLIGRDEVSGRQFACSAAGVVAGLAFFVLVPAALASDPSGPLLPGELVAFTVACLFTLLVVTPIAYRWSRRLRRDQRKRLGLSISVLTNLGILGFFKYFDFFVSSAETLARSLGMTQVELLHLDIVLPVGISFYTFQTLSYSIGIYRGEAEPTSDYVSFSLFVAFFPQLVAGPIERASHLLPEMLAARRIRLDQVSKGLFLILLGLFKKIGISNGVSGSVDAVYNSSATASSLDIGIATVLFAIQIYCDFSGYSDIARGSAKVFGFELMRNFEQPYFSTNPSEFWRRWHISLSSWLRDYLYISLGGNRGGLRRTYRNLTLTMVIGGLWHGAAWNFVLWGAYQGLILCIHRYVSQSTAFLSRLEGRFWKLGLTGLFFGITCYGWLLFRASSFEQIASFSRTLFLGFDGSLSIPMPTFSAILGLVVLAGIDLGTYRTSDPYFYRRLPSFVQGAIFAALVFVFLMGTSNEPTQFIYFQF